MAANVYILCGENGLLIKRGITFPQARFMLDKYFKGLRYVKGTQTLREAQQYAYTYALGQAPPIKIDKNLSPNTLVLFRGGKPVISPMSFYAANGEEEVF